ncbi:MAG: ferrochelatase, partial [Pseudomonadota bacterium]
YWSMRRYLSEFLSDTRVIETSKWIWQPILQGIILTIRPSKSAEAYKSIWLEDTDESPLRKYTRDQAAALSERVGNSDVVVDWAMRYGKPSIASRLESLREQGCQRILVMALYPQYSATTMATVYDKTFLALKDMRWQPSLRTLPAFHDHPVYIDRLAASIEKGVAAAGFDPEVVLLSYHGIPKTYFDKGDPYHCHCCKTTRLVRERLGWSEDRLRMSFQSRFGPAEWLQPYTDKTLETLGEQGIKRVMVAAPAFISDCVETLEEMALEGRDTFLEAGGEQFATIPCLNASEECIDVLETLAGNELSGWCSLN